MILIIKLTQEPYTEVQYILISLAVCSTLLPNRHVYLLNYHQAFVQVVHILDPCTVGKVGSLEMSRII